MRTWKMKKAFPQAFSGGKWRCIYTCYPFKMFSEIKLFRELFQQVIPESLRSQTEDYFQTALWEQISRTRAERIGIPWTDKLYMVYSVLEQGSVTLLLGFFSRNTNFQMKLITQVLCIFWPFLMCHWWLASFEIFSKDLKASLHQGWACRRLF